MIAQGEAIAHGAKAIEYALDKERARLVNLNGLPDNIEPLAMWLRMMQLQHQNMKDRNSPKPITLNALRFEISPAVEETADWTMDDWQKLADDFMRTLDGIDYRPGKPSQKLRKTDIRNSQYVVSLHTDSKSGIPHLHIVANRIDNMGRTNDAHYIGERAAHAANLINERRGWVQSMQRRDENIERIYSDCMAILKAMPSFDWDTYCNMVTAKGYHIQTKPDSQDKIRGYSIRMGNSIYKSSEIGVGRKLMPSKIEATWAKLHSQKTQSSATVTNNSGGESRNYATVINDSTDKHTLQPQNTSSCPHYSIPVDGRVFEIDIPDMVKSIFDEEFKALNALEDVPATDFVKVAALLFAGYLDAATSMAASSGGGGSPGTGWGKDKDEDERNRARRCAKMAHWMCKPVKRSHKR